MIYKKIKKYTAGIMAVVSIFGCTLAQTIPIKAEEKWPEGPQINSPCAIVMEVNTGTVLYEKNSHEVHYPASITKILTTLLAIENSNLEDIVTFSADAVYLNEGDTSHISRDLNEQMTMEECLYGVMLESANECAYAVAEHVGSIKGGDYSTFIDLMNEKAASLGCTDTHFNNCNGLPDEEHYTSAYDMALISSEAYRNETFKSITGTKTYTIPPTNKHADPTYLNNHHKILHNYKTGNYVNESCTGGKTGFTKVANSTLVTFAERNGLSICVVIMNANDPDHFVDTNTLIEYSFSNFRAYNIIENEQSIQESKNKNLGVLNANGSFVTLNSDAYIVLPNTVDFSAATFELDENTNDESVAALSYTYANRTVGKVEIVPTGAKIEHDYFEKKDEKTQNKIVKVKSIYILLILVFIALLVIIILGIKKFYDNFYVIRHNLGVRTEQRRRFREIKRRNRRPRRKDRLFK